MGTFLTLILLLSISSFVGLLFRKPAKMESVNEKEYDCMHYDADSQTYKIYEFKLNQESRVCVSTKN